MRSNARATPRGLRPAAVFVDLDDLVATLAARFPDAAQAEGFAVDALRALPEFLGRVLGLRVQSARAYADYGALDGAGAVQRDLHGAGVDPVYTGGQANAAEVALAMEVAAYHARSADGPPVVLVTGARRYAPLVRRLRHDGRGAFVFAAEPPAEAEGAERVFNLFDLAPEAAPAAEAVPRAPREGITYVPVEAPGVLRALEIIEEHFGQYEEVYLTPLLRKLTEEFAETEHDPKTLVSDLEAHGAVFLERRKGYPHDYTVLLVDEQHPDVERVRALYEDYDEDDEDGYAGEDVAADENEAR